MTLYTFNALSPTQQLAHVWDQGTYLAQRVEAGDGVSLYHLPGGFFVEIYYDMLANQIAQLRSFRSSAPLEHYMAYVRLPGWLE